MLEIHKVSEAIIIAAYGVSPYNHYCKLQLLKVSTSIRHKFMRYLFYFDIFALTKGTTCIH